MLSFHTEEIIGVEDECRKTDLSDCVQVVCKVLSDMTWKPGSGCLNEKLS